VTVQLPNWGRFAYCVLFAWRAHPRQSPPIGPGLSAAAGRVLVRFSESRAFAVRRASRAFDYLRWCGRWRPKLTGSARPGCFGGGDADTSRSTTFYMGPRRAAAEALSHGARLGHSHGVHLGHHGQPQGVTHAFATTLSRRPHPSPRDERLTDRRSSYLLPLWPQLGLLPPHTLLQVLMAGGAAPWLLDRFSGRAGLGGAIERERVTSSRGEGRAGIAHEGRKVKRDVSRSRSRSGAFRICGRCARRHHRGDACPVETILAFRAGIPSPGQPDRISNEANDGMLETGFHTFHALADDPRPSPAPSAPGP